MKVIFSHGKETGPMGRKIKVLSKVAENLGLKTESIDYRESLDPDFRANKLIALLKKEKDEVLLVGSSMGAYVSILASEEIEVKGLFLLAPALYLEGYAKQNFENLVKNTEIFHGWSDDVVPVENALKYSTAVKCSINILEADHGLSESHVLSVIESRFKDYLQKIIQN